MELALRDWQADDLEWWLALRRIMVPHFGDTQLRQLATGADYLIRQVATLDAQPVGWVSARRRIGQPAVAANLMVAPEARDRGVGRRLWSVLAEAGYPTLETMVDESDLRSAAIAEHWGFVRVSHARISLLTLPDTHTLPDTQARPDSAGPAEGFTLRVVMDADLDSARLDEMLVESDTSPEVEHGWSLSHARLRQMFPSMVWVTVADQWDQLVAVTSAAPSDDGKWSLIHTGVRPSFRRRGLARAAKARLHAEAHARGARTIQTANEVGNLEILALNAAMGYLPVEGEIRMQRREEVQR